MSLLVARQPVLDTDQNTWGYELLFRSGFENAFLDDKGMLPDGDEATMSVMDNAFFNGLGQLTGGRKALVNFTRNLLLGGYAEILPKETVIIEILEDINPDESVVEACYNLKSQGYTIALDDFKYNPIFDELLSVADIVKVDFTVSKAEDRINLADKLLPMGIKLLAEKVETQEEFNHSKELGYTFFQGYFFSKPQIIKRQQMPESTAAKLRLLTEVNKPDIDFNDLENIFKTDPGLTMRLLRYMNSAFFGFSQEITSIKQAITLLGQRNLRKWATILAMSDTVENKAPELLKQAIFRARYCELLATAVSRRLRTDDFFLAGLLSMAEAMLDSPKEVIFEDMVLSDHLKQVLVDGFDDTLLGASLDIVKSIETGNWDVIDAMAEQYKIPFELISTTQKEAAVWAEDVIASNER
ncbi:MAG: EAL and HDOD domain-containing protein [Planctomycetota bacterium]